MRLDFDGRLQRSNRADIELAQLADRHYSRQKPGTPQFVAPGRPLVLRDAAGLVLFVWLSQDYRADQQAGYCCAAFRNESDRRASEVIVEAEQILVEEWGADRVFTYVNPRKIRRMRTPGRCFLKAGWRLAGASLGGLILLEKPADRLGVWPS